MVGALYNIVDQFFIGHSIGELGNAATNVAFPLSMSCTAIALLFGIGGAAAFNLTMGEGNREKAVHYMGNAVSLLIAGGVVLAAVSLIFLTPLLKFFGSPANVLGYAQSYTGIVAVGFPFLILSIGGGHLIRADGSPRYAMLCNLSGAILNVFLDALFIFGFGMGMAGAALATVIGQVLSFCLAIRYLSRCKTVRIERRHLIPRRRYAGRIVSLGTSSFFNQIAMMVVQIVMNNSLTYYGGLSAYGESIPLACAGIITKVSQVFFSVVIGLSQGLQPIASFNYGARQFGRAKQVCLLALRAGLLISVAAFLVFQFLPRQIIALFGNGSEKYFQFAVAYFRIYLFCTFLNCVQPITSTFFTAIGKPKKGIFLSLTRQILFLLPLIVIFPLFMGIDGIMYAGPVADFVAGVVSAGMIVAEMRRMDRESAAAAT